MEFHSDSRENWDSTVFVVCNSTEKVDTLKVIEQIPTHLSLTSYVQLTCGTKEI